MIKRVVNADPQTPLPADVLSILETVVEERDRAMNKWGVQSHPDGTGGRAAEVLRDAAREDTDEAAREGTVTWKQILMEEVREAFAETDLVALDNELMQVMQVCCVWREDLRRRMAEAGHTVLTFEVENLSPKAIAAITGDPNAVHDARVQEALNGPKF